MAKYKTFVVSKREQAQITRYEKAQEKIENRIQLASDRLAAGDIKGAQTVMKQLAKTADERMRQIEKSGNIDMQSMTYATTQKELGSKSRFGQKRPDNARELNAELGKMERFLRAKSSTKTGVDIANKNKTEAMNEKFGTSFTPEQMEKFFESSTWEKLSKLIYAGDTFDLVATIQEIDIDEQMLVDIEENGYKHLNLSGLGLRGKKLKQALQDAGIDVRDLIKDIKG